MNILSPISRPASSPTLLAFGALLLSLSLSGCIEEGHSPDCAVGGHGNLEEAGCLTPIGGSCLTEEEFKEGRPGEHENRQGETVTLEEDWTAYQEERPECDFGASDSE